MSYPNQKIIYCVPEERKKNDRYGSLSRKAEIVSARLLNDGSASHIVFLHFALHKRDHKFELSKQELENYLGISAKQYRKAITMLEKAGYLTRSKPNSNIYYFKRIPDHYKDMDIIDIIAEQGNIAVPTSNDTVTFKENNVSPQSKNSALEVYRNIPNTTNKTVIEKATNDTFAIDLPKTESEDTATAFDSEEKQWLFHISDIGYKFRTMYKSMLRAAQWGNTADGIKIERVLNKYLSTHTESATLKRLGDKYGRFIQGWNGDTQTPLIAYATSFVAKEQMKHHIENIPKEYYL